MLITFIRTIILYLLVVASLRIMGKRQIGELQPSELVIAIMISDLASIPMQSSEVPLISGIIPILTLITLEVFLSFFSLKFKWFRTLACGKPSVIIKDGIVNEKEMKMLRFSYFDLKEELRKGGCDNIKEIKYAILETDGELSIILKEEERPLTIKTMRMLMKKEKK